MEVQTSRFIDKDAAREWLAEHGVDINSLRSLTITMERPTDLGHPIWLNVEFYKLDENGKAYLTQDASGDSVIAIGTASIPIQSWPPLLAAPVDE